MAEIHAPAGLVNTMVEQAGGRKRIRVLVDGSYRFRLTVPKMFMGFDVVVDVKEPFAAFGR